jgi:flagellar hook-length control protein FliK
MSALVGATTTDISATIDTTQLVTVGATGDFRALIASLSQLELPVAEAASALVNLLPLPAADAVLPEKTANSDAGVTQPATDLQAAIAAMSTLPWPVSAALPAPAGNDTDPVEAKTEFAGAASTKLLPDPGTSDSNAATVLSQLIRKTDLPADNKQAQQPQPVTDAATEPTAQIGKIAGAAMLLDAEAAQADHQQQDRPESHGNQAMAELRASFSAVLSETSISAKVERTVSVPVHDARWPAAMANEVRWCAQAGIQSATLKLVPDNLGPIEMHVDLQDSKVNVNFTANQLDTRNALEQSLPRLRELLAGSGLMLGQANVQQEARRDSQFAGVTPRIAPADSADAAEVRVARIAIGLVDEYA